MENKNVRFALDFVERDYDFSTDDLYQCFKNVEDNLWPYILGKYISTPKSNLLPALAPESIQKKYHGTSGIKALTQSLYLFQSIKETYQKHGKKALSDSKVLDFGFGWGRVLRFFYKEMPTNQIYGCDPSDEAMGFIDRLGLKGNFAQSDFVPTALPFKEKFDIIYASSVFTHLSEKSHLACIKSISEGLSSNGLAFLTVRPPDFIHRNEALKAYLKVLNVDFKNYKPGYIFAPNKNFVVDGEYTYGHSVMSKGYIKKHWGKYFKIVDAKFQAFDPYQIVIILAKL